MNILDNVLQYCTPAEWQYVSCSDYDHARYKLFEVRVGGQEYATEVNAFVNGDPRLDVHQIQRVQNPYQLGRFVLRQEQKKYRGECVQVVKYYHPLRSGDLEVALEHNMDYRRYRNRQQGQEQSKSPKFYKTPGAAFNAMNSCDTVLVCKVLEEGGFTSSKSYDTEYMPVYVAKVTAN